MPFVRLTTDRVVGNYLQRADDEIEVSADEAARLLAAGQAEPVAIGAAAQAAVALESPTRPASPPKPTRRR